MIKWTCQNYIELLLYSVTLDNILIYMSSCSNGQNRSYKHKAASVKYEKCVMDYYF